jgi:hypothetical protein
MLPVLLVPLVVIVVDVLWLASLFKPLPAPSTRAIKKPQPESEALLAFPPWTAALLVRPAIGPPRAVANDSRFQLLLFKGCANSANSGVS